MVRVFAPPKIGPYTLDAARQKANGHVFDARWKKQGQTAYEGSALLKYHEDDALLVGKWLGPDKFGVIRGGEWYLKHANTKDSIHSFVQSSMRLCPLLEAYEAIRAGPSVLTNVIENHEKGPRYQTISVKGVALKLNDGTFNPLCGVLSEHLLEEAERYVKSGMQVLDLGTGSGFHAIYLAKNKGCKCTGVDISRDLLDLANFNSKENGTEHLTTFKKCDEKDIYSWAAWHEEFDIILANLPFSSVRNTYRSRRSAYYKSFCGSRTLLTQVILGSLWHIKPEGKLFISFGNSGYVRLFDYLIDLSPWQSSQMWAHKGPLDYTWISKLELSSDFMVNETTRVAIDALGKAYSES